LPAAGANSPAQGHLAAQSEDARGRMQDQPDAIALANPSTSSDYGKMAGEDWQPGLEKGRPE